MRRAHVPVLEHAVDGGDVAGQGRSQRFGPEDAYGGEQLQRHLQDDLGRMEQHRSANVDAIGAVVDLVGGAPGQGHVVQRAAPRVHDRRQDGIARQRATDHAGPRAVEPAVRGHRVQRQQQRHRRRQLPTSGRNPAPSHCQPWRGGKSRAGQSFSVAWKNTQARGTSGLSMSMAFMAIRKRPVPAARAQRAALKPGRIVAAALELVGESGISAFSTRRLGEAMGIYHHFPSKQHLLDAMVGEVIARFRWPPPGLDPVEHLRRVCHAYRETAHRYPKLFPCVAVHRLNMADGVDFIERVLAALEAMARDRAARWFRVVGYYLFDAGLDETSGHAPGSAAAEPVSDAHVAAHCTAWPRRCRASANRNGARTSTSASRPCSAR